MKVTFDGKEYDKGSDEHIAAMQAKLDGHTTAIATLTTAKEKAEGRADAAEQATKDTQVKLDGALSPERVDALVSARVDLVVAATKVLGTNVKFDGKTDREIIDFMVARYGDFVLYRPPLRAGTVLLWLGPLLLFGLAAVALYRYFRHSPMEEDT